MSIDTLTPGSPAGSAPRHLSGNCAPVAAELTAHDLPVTGRIPDAPSGWCLRTSPTPELSRRDRAGSVSGGREAVLRKWTRDPAAGTVREEQCDDRPGEFSRVGDRQTGRQAEFGHVTCAH
ncbi:hypothetical protein [Streptomyces sp. NPDC004267]|uniref:hypothetical protein n=1 Tax=Streptomyces sp. NPDC004267 TaxID=3364694 RepID=UPI0036BD4685